MGACSRSLYRSPPAAPREQHRGRKLRSLRRQLGSEVPLQDRCTRGLSCAPFRARLPPHVREHRADRRSLPEELLQGVTEGRERLRSGDPAAARVRDRFLRGSAECFAHGSEGLVVDSELLYRRWAFDVGKIERRVHMWQGLADTLVPAPINKEIADKMPGSVWHPVEGAGHFVAIGSANEVLAIAASELGAADRQ